MTGGGATRILRIIGIIAFIYLFFGFMLLPCLSTLISIFSQKNAAGKVEPLAVIKFFFAGNMPKYVLNSLLLAVCLTVTVNVVGILLVLLTEYFDIKGARVLRLGYMTTLIYSGVALVTGFLFLYDQDGLVTRLLQKFIPGLNKNWFAGFGAVLFTMTFACTSNHMLFLRNAIRGIDYNTVEAARNMGAGPMTVLFKIVLPTLLPTLISLTVMTFITGLCAMSAPTLIGYDAINPEIVRLAGAMDESFPQARAALLSVILAMFTIVLLLVLTHYENKGHYLSVSKTKAKLVKQKITNPVANVGAHVLAYVLFLIYMLPVVMIIIFSFQGIEVKGTEVIDHVKSKDISLSALTMQNYFGSQTVTVGEGTQQVTYPDAIMGLFNNVNNTENPAAHVDTLQGILNSTLMSIAAAFAACLIVVIVCNYIFKHKSEKKSKIMEYCLLFPWLLPTILICTSYRVYFNSDVWYTGGVNLYTLVDSRLLIILAYTVVKLPFSLRMIKASFYSIDEELEDAARNIGAGPLRTFTRVKLPIVLPSVLAVLALCFNQLFSEYDMSASFASRTRSYGMIIKTLTDVGQNIRAQMNNLNYLGRQCASTVFIMMVSGLVLYLVYGVGARDLAERLAIREKRSRRWAGFKRKTHLDRLFPDVVEKTGIVKLTKAGYSLLKTEDAATFGNVVISGRMSKKYKLRSDDTVYGTVRMKGSLNKTPVMRRVRLINGSQPADIVARTRKFEDLSFNYPDRSFTLPCSAGDGEIEVGFGQRSLLYVDSEADRASFFASIAARVCNAAPDAEVICLLPENIPENVSLLRNSTKADVSFTLSGKSWIHTGWVCRRVLHKGRRNTVQRKDTVVLVDGMDRLEDRKYTGLLRQLFAGAGNTHEGGTLTVIACVNRECDCADLKMMANMNATATVCDGRLPVFEKDTVQYRKGEVRPVAPEDVERLGWLQRNMKPIIALVAAATAICLIAVTVNLLSDSAASRMERRYQEAAQLKADGKYTEAILAFSKLDGYTDSEAQIESCRTAQNEKVYREALRMQKNEDYDGAIASFTSVYGYSDSVLHIDECKYLKAQKLEDEHAYDAAIALYSELYGYEDSSERLKECMYQKAIGLKDNGEYDEAILAFRNLGNYEGCEDQINDCIYLRAVKMMDDGMYEQAIEQFNTVKNHKDSKDKINECNYLNAVALKETGEYDKAIQMFEKLMKKDYPGSSLQRLECYYLKALKLIEEGKPDKAWKWLEKVKKDTTAANMPQENAQAWEQATEMANNGQYVEAVDMVRSVFMPVDAAISE